MPDIVRLHQEMSGFVFAEKDKMSGNYWFFSNVNGHETTPSLFQLFVLTKDNYIMSGNYNNQKDSCPANLS